MLNKFIRYCIRLEYIYGSGNRSENLLSMAPKRRNPLPDSLAANPATSRTLTRFIATGVIKPGDKPQNWYNHP